MRNVVFCDIDGTIIDGTRGMYDVSFKTRYAVNELKKQGDSVIIASDRNKGLRQLRVPLRRISHYGRIP